MPSDSAGDSAPFPSPRSGSEAAFPGVARFWSVLSPFSVPVSFSVSDAVPVSEEALPVSEEALPVSEEALPGVAGLPVTVVFLNSAEFARVLKEVPAMAENSTVVVITAYTAKRCFLMFYPLL